jgi:HAD superfamily phosphatase (TIGR01668 family)
MTKASILQPDLILGNTILHLTPTLLDHYQIKGLILDVDETLVPFSQSDISPELQAWVESLRHSMPLCLVSNNVSEQRIGRIARALDLPYLLAAVKPSRRKLRQALEIMQLPPAQVAMVGDRLFTDVLAGNRLGLFTILVEPMLDPSNLSHALLTRNLEARISQCLGVSLQHSSHKFTESDNSLSN